MKRKSKRKEIGKKIKPSATKAKTNEAYGVTDETALGGKHQDGDGCTSRPSGVLGDITNSAKQSQKNTKRRGTCLTLAPMELTLVRDKDTATPSIQARPSPYVLSVASLLAGDCQSIRSTTQRKPTDKLPISNHSGIKTGRDLKGKQLVPKATSSPIGVEAVCVV
jgi:hypothetical protein